MKKAVLLSASVFLFSVFCSAQDWVNMMHDNSVNVHDVEKAFNAWYATYGKDGGFEAPGNKGEDGNVENFYRWRKMALSHANPDGSRPDPNMVVKEYYNALAAKNTMRTTATSNWTYAGLPTNNPFMVGNGRVNRIAFYPGSDSVLFACTPMGGLWKSKNGGSTWSTNTDLLPELGLSDMAIDPVNPKIMYLATGDADAFSGTTVGVLKSTDGGNTWDTTGLYYTVQTSGPSNTETCRILISPANDSILYAATTAGIYYSLNAGLTWSKILSGNVRGLEFEPFHPLTMYASTYDGKFYRTTDGVTFTQVTSGLPSAGYAGRMAIGVSPADSNIVYVVACAVNTYAFYGLYYSTDRGQTFTKQSGSPNILGWTQTGTDATGQGWYDLTIAVSPTNADSVYVGAPNIWLSVNKGVNWTNITYNVIHVDNHHLVFAPGSNKVMYLAEDGGVFKTSDAGTSWSDISNNLAIAQEYCIGISATNPNYVISGWQDDGTNLNNNGTWNYQTNGDGEYCFVDYTNDNNMYAAGYLTGYMMTNSGGAWWNAINTGITGQLNANGPFLEDPIYPQILFAGMQNVWKFNGTSWSRISSWGNNYITALAVAPSNDQVIYAAEYTSTYVAAMYITTNGGTSWTNISSGLPVTLAGISAIAVDPANSKRVWVTCNGFSGNNKVFQSVNGGSNWTNISTGIPNIPVLCAVYQKGSPDAIYVGTDEGVYYRDSIIGSWISYNNGLPNVTVNDIRIYAPSNIVMAATYGRGTWATPAYIAVGVNNLNISDYIKVYPNPAKDMLTVSMDMPDADDYKVSLTNVIGETVYENTLHVSGKYLDKIDVAGYGKGIYFISVTGKNSRLVKKVVLY